MTTILTKKKDTTGAPAPGDLTNAAGGAELAVNTYDKRLYTKDSGGNVVEVGTNPTILNIDNIQIDGNTISSTNSNGNINLTPNGTGSVVISKLNVTGDITFDGNVTVGNASTDTLTITGTTVTTPNGLNFDSNTFVIDAANNRVGVGIASPLTNLQVVGTTLLGSASTYGASTAAISVYNGSSSANYYKADNHYWQLAAGTDTVTINSSGNFGIGTSSPSYRLQVVTPAVSGRQTLSNINKTTQNWVRFTNPEFSTDASMGLLLRVFPDSDSRQGAGILASGGINNSATELDIFSTNTSGVTTSAIKIDSSLNVGIGTTTPATFLDVATTGSVTATVRSTSTSGTRGAKLRLNVPSAGGDDPAGTIEFTYDTGYTVAGSIQVTSTPNNMKFFTGATERMRIDGSGNVGIGNTTPYAPLAFANTAGTAGAINKVALYTDSTNPVYGFGISSGQLNYVVASSAAHVFYNNAPSPTERMRLDPSGNLGIGTASPTSPIHVVAASSGVVAQFLGPNAYSAESGIAVSQGRAKISGFLESSGGTPGAYLSFYTMPNGGSITERMRITSDGYLLVGTTSSTGSLSNYAPAIAGQYYSYQTSFGATTAGTNCDVTGIPVGTYLVTVTAVGVYHSRATYWVGAYDTADYGYSTIGSSGYGATQTVTVTGVSYNSTTFRVSFSNNVSAVSINFQRLA